jgi:hypothetical protein
VLRDHIAQGAAAHLLEDFVADATAAPGDLFPDENAKAIAELEDPPRLLVMGETNEVGTHLFNEVHLLLDEIVGHGCGVTGVIFVSMRSAEEEAFSVELEGAMIDPFGVPNPKGLVRCVLSVGSGQRDAALVECRLAGLQS